jgi:hypothetical protein
MARTTKTIPKPKGPKRGVCRVCGCTDLRACPGGCRWADKEHTVCTQCVARALVLMVKERLNEGGDFRLRLLERGPGEAVLFNDLMGGFFS